MSSIAQRRTFLLRFVFPSICGSLGIWQIFRWQQKKEILREAQANIFAKPVKVESFNEMSSAKSSKFTIEPQSSGLTALLGPRGFPTGYGYTLFERAQLANGEVVVLNRGNLKMNEAASGSENVPQLPEKVIVVADKEEHEPLFARENRPDRILWRNWAVLREALQIPSTVPVRFLKVINDPALKADNQHHLTIHQIPNRHAEYIATWFSLATFSAIMSFIRK